LCLREGTPMSGAQSRDGTGGSAPTEPPGLAVIVVILAVVLMLMAFSSISWWMGNTTLAAIAGTGVVTLATEVIRRFLSYESARRPPDPGWGDEPTHPAPNPRPDPDLNTGPEPEDPISSSTPVG